MATTGQTVGALRELLRPHRLRAVVAIAVLVGAASSALAVPALLGHIVDLVADGRPASALTPTVIALLSVTAAEAALVALGQVLIAQVGESMLATMRERVFGHAVELPLGEIERAGTGDLVARVGDDVAVTASAVRYALPELAISGLWVGLTIVGLGILDWRLALAGLCAAPVQAWTVRWYLGRSGPVYAAERRAGSRRSQALLESLGGLRTVRALGLEREHEKRIAERSLAMVDLSLQAVRLQTRFYGRLNLAEVCGTSAILVVGFLLVDSGDVTIGQATAGVLYFIRLFDPLNTLLGLMDDAQQAGACLARLVGVTTLPHPVRPERPTTPRDSSVDVDGASFAYTPGHDVLVDIDLRVQPNERVALIGVSGAGKTTLAKLVAGVLTPSRGDVRLGGERVADLGSHAARAAVGLVTQEIHTFAGTLAEDLRLACPDADDARLRAALDAVGALAWAQALPDGLETVVGEGGHRLTATQAQQLALARLVLADPPIALLDEATADAGSAGARVLDASAEQALDGRTSIVVAHRLTQARDADRVVVLDGGRLQESGTHDELLAAGGSTRASGARGARLVRDA